MKLYTITWAIEVEADSYTEAAREALKIQRDQSSHATIFNVHRHGDIRPVTIHLIADECQPPPPVAEYAQMLKRGDTYGIAETGQRNAWGWLFVGLCLVAGLVAMVIL